MCTWWQLLPSTWSWALNNYMYMHVHVYTYVILFSHELLSPSCCLMVTHTYLIPTASNLTKSTKILVARWSLTNIHVHAISTPPLPGTNGIDVDTLTHCVTLVHRRQHCLVLGTSSRTLYPSNWSYDARNDDSTAAGKENVMYMYVHL